MIHDVGIGVLGSAMANAIMALVAFVSFSGQDDRCGDEFVLHFPDPDCPDGRPGLAQAPLFVAQFSNGGMGGVFDNTRKADGHDFPSRSFICPALPRYHLKEAELTVDMITSLPVPSRVSACVRLDSGNNVEEARLTTHVGNPIIQRRIAGEVESAIQFADPDTELPDWRGLSATDGWYSVEVTIHLLTLTD